MRPLLACIATSQQLIAAMPIRSEEHTSELQSHVNLVCRLLLEKKKKKSKTTTHRSHSHHARRQLHSSPCPVARALAHAAPPRFFLIIRRPPTPTLFPYTTLFRSQPVRLPMRCPPKTRQDSRGRCGLS